MKKYFLIPLLLALTTACAIPEHHMQSKFDKKTAEIMMKKGKNTIKGEGFLRQRNGHIIKCSGYTASLIPETDYATERLSKLYGNTEKSYKPYWQRGYTFIPDDPDYHNLQKVSICNGDGKFEFKNISDGNFFIVLPIMWEVPSSNGTSPTGGTLMQKIRVQGGETKEVIMTY